MQISTIAILWSIILQYPQHTIVCFYLIINGLKNRLPFSAKIKRLFNQCKSLGFKSPTPQLIVFCSFYIWFFTIRIRFTPGCLPQYRRMNIYRLFKHLFKAMRNPRNFFNPKMYPFLSILYESVPTTSTSECFKR